MEWTQKQEEESKQENIKKLQKQEEELYQKLTKGFSMKKKRLLKDLIEIEISLEKHCNQ